MWSSVGGSLVLTQPQIAVKNPIYGACRLVPKIAVRKPIFGALPSSTKNIISPVIKGPVIKGPVIKGPVIKGPGYQRSSY